MPSVDATDIILQTKKWITDVVVGCGFCPFAAKEIRKNSIHYEVLSNSDKSSALQALILILRKLDINKELETSLLILPEGFKSFGVYLQLTDLADALLKKENYEGVYQIAGFHPHYLFVGSVENDAANYTNRSPYPMLHILREESVTKAVDDFPDINEVPARNIRFARQKGIDFMKKLLSTSTHIS